jgi:SecD/SecF fusion protein
MKNKLLPRFILIIGTIVLAWLCLKHYPLKGGPDLAGGTSLLYELQIPEGTPNPQHLAEEVIGTLRNRIDPLDQKNYIWRVVGGRRIQLQIPAASAESTKARDLFRAAERAISESGITAQDVVNISKKTGEERKNEITRKALNGADKKALEAELAKLKTEQAAVAARAAAEKLAGGITKPTETALNEIDAKVADAATSVDVLTKRETLLTDLAAIKSDLDAAETEANRLTDENKPLSAALLARIADDYKQYEAKQSQLFALNVSASRIKALLESMETGSAKADAEYKQVLVDYPAQRVQIEAMKAAADYMAKFRDQSADDPEEIKRLLRGSGKLDFRICVRNSDVGGVKLIADAKVSLKTMGPRKSIGSAKWFEVDAKGMDNFFPGGMPSPELGTMELYGKSYVLLYTDASQALTHDIAGQKWTLTDAYATRDETGKVIVGFKFDPSGGYLFGELTKNNVGKPMAILLDDRAISAPNINTPITGGSGVITFGSKGGKALEDEAQNLVKTLKAGSLAAALVPEPISEEHVEAAMGASNIESGLRSAIIAVIAVMGFMVIYYTITGMFANLALMINLLITLAVMAFLGATFTMPGIAGIVLTLGMAVDANVLINERIREEVHKGGSLWMAVKQGYDKVFWTIFDANLTTSLTSIVLILVGSEGVKGFGVTLLIGLIIHMFTALFVTRTLMIAAIRWGILKQIDDHSVSEYIREVFTFTWLKGRWPFMRVVHVTNIDWIGKRYYFWIVSAVITIAGLIAFISRGDDKYDTEFRGGTQVTFQTPPMTDKEVKAKINEIAEDKQLEKDYPEITKALEEPLVYAVQTSGAAPTADGKSTTFRLETTLSDTTTRKVKQPFLDALAAKFPNPGAQLKLTVKGLDDKMSLDSAIRTFKDAGHMVPIVDGRLARNFPKLQLTGGEEVYSYVGGLGIYLEGINPPQSIDAFTERLRATRLSSSGTSREPKLIGIHKVPGTETYDSIILVTRDEQILYDATNPASGFENVEESELSTIITSLQPVSPFKQVNSIDSVVAGQAKGQALLAIVISLTLIVIYVWIRFGGIRYGFGAILSLAHDAIVALAATVLCTYVYKTAIGEAFLLMDFKINLTMIAAYLTIIGYSVNDTIVIFDRIRENKGRQKGPLDAKIINDSINQCFGRTIWTTFTVFVVLMIMYIWGGEGVHGFSFAMLIGVITGAYSTLAIASPMLLGIKEIDVPPQPSGKSIVKKKAEEVA